MSLYNAIKTVLRPTTRLLFDVQVSGTENVPANGPLVVAANHLSYIDPPILGTWFPRTIHFMAKQELFEMPLLGWVIKRTHAFPVQRRSGDVGAIRRALHILKSGEAVGIFPEGTRNITGEHEARGGAVLLGVLGNSPVVPVAITGTNVAAKRLRGAHVRVRIGMPIRFQGSEKKPTKAELEQWTNTLARSIEALKATPAAS